MFKLGNTSAENINFPMTRTEFKSWRRLLGWSQSQAARQLGLDKSDITDYETRGHIPESVQIACQYCSNEKA
jgi:DNA-binding XRE family transcriptional regulator